MAKPGNAVIYGSRPVEATDINNLLVDLEGARGVFSGTVIDYRMPCTASEARTCQIVANLTVWNEFLCPLYLELQELPEAGRQLGLMQVNKVWYEGSIEIRLREAATVLYWLLYNHHCVARIHIGHMITSPEKAELCIPVLWNTLDGNSSVKSVILDFSFPKGFKSEENEKLSEVILSLKCLEELKLPSWYSICPRSVSEISRSMTKLTVLDWSSLVHIESTLAQRLLTVLKTNTTLRDLSLSVAVISADPALFDEFLTGNARLQNLRVVSNCYCCSDDSLRWIFKGMLKNRSVSSLQADKVTLDCESVELASKLLAENKVLRCFRVLPPAYVLNKSTALLVRVRLPPNTTTWQEAVARNRTLRYMTLNFSIWSAEHWGPFFRVLSKHTSLKMVTIVVERKEYRLLPGVVKALQENGAEVKVFFKAPYIANELAVTDCKPLCELSILLLDETKDRMLPLFLQLSTFSHLKELSLKLSSWDCTIYSAISEFISLTSTLRKLCVDLNMLFAPELVEWCPALARSLLLNRSIADLSVSVSRESDENVELLGDAVIRSPTIRKLTLMTFDADALSYFLRGLHAGILNNYTMCSVTVDNMRDFIMPADWFTVLDTTRRNSGFVARAAQFLNGERCDRLCAAGLDRVSRHPALVAELAEVLAIDQVEAADMVQRRFRSIEGLHEFMRLAGVVKERVTCLPREDRRTQLDDLNDDCWAHVRRYLQLDDVPHI
ncbi:hypothetical protein HPB49_022228 [Dermacentor silvarum]|uniref:Uncharacterized protein n=1 Tax=Dermacentor silvarum TaxID=543639 RepID=A0ACB8CTH3_DERSI|nr:uncharacterized protein LOC125945671 [Dermacentor silvarum]KAH7950309.1 hypothetical protein HPB49_022228 [Dermacentor silvarum]